MASNGSDPTTSRPEASEALGVKEVGKLKDDAGSRRIKSLNWLPSRPARQHDASMSEQGGSHAFDAKAHPRWKEG
jgi:hypothetical protein